MNYELNHVFRHYRHNALNPSRAYRQFAEATGLRARATRLRIWFSAAAATLVLADAIRKWQHAAGPRLARRRTGALTAPLAADLQRR